jgi:hypothetical protein
MIGRLLASVLEPFNEARPPYCKRRMGRPAWPHKGAPPQHIVRALNWLSRVAATLCVAATNNAAQDRIGERGCQWLAVGEQCRFRRNGLEAGQAVTLARAVDVPVALPRHIGKDLIKIDPRRGYRCGRKSLKHEARTHADADSYCNCELLRDHDFRTPVI